ncbi:hypothetical protein ACHAO8_000943 [Botrytis cinerea]
MVRRAERKHSPEWGTEGQQIGDEPLDVEFTSENERHLSNEDCAAAVWNLAWKALEIIVHPANKPTKFFNPNLKLPRMEKAAERLGNEWNGLKDYQLEGIGLLDASEAGERGIATGTALNDVMGLGKTLQIIALLELTRRRPVLIIGPALALETWKEEFHKWQSPVPKICHFHGKELAQQNANDLARFDVTKIPTFDVDWSQIILDEAQNIKNKKGKYLQACCALKGDSKIVITGTPILNAYTDIFSYAYFLNFKPLNQSTWFKSHFVKKTAESTKLT